MPETNTCALRSHLNVLRDNRLLNGKILLKTKYYQTDQFIETIPSQIFANRVNPYSDA